MDTKKSLFKRIVKWLALIIISLAVILFIIGTVHTNSVEKTQNAVDKIHSTKLTIDDVMGKNLPPDPGAEADKTIQGIDANKNNIRDDVELAIFKEYPNSAKTRAVLLQYALALQMEMTQDVVNKDITEAFNEENSRAYSCIGQIVPRSNDDIEKIEQYKNFITNKQLNTFQRKQQQDKIDRYMGSFTLKTGCDLDLNIF